MLEKETQSPDISKYHHTKAHEFDDSGFKIRPLKKMRLIDSFEGLDDECEFEKNMFNFGDYEDLPESDRAFDQRCKPH